MKGNNEHFSATPDKILVIKKLCQQVVQFFWYPDFSHKYSSATHKTCQSYIQLEYYSESIQNGFKTNEAGAEISRLN